LALKLGKILKKQVHDFRKQKEIQVKNPEMLNLEQNYKLLRTNDLHNITAQI
jgi:hypothetical protein